MTRHGRRYGIAQSAILTECGLLVCIGYDDKENIPVMLAAQDHGQPFMSMPSGVSFQTILSCPPIIHALINSKTVPNINDIVLLLIKIGVYMVVVEGKINPAEIMANHCARNFGVVLHKEFDETFFLAKI